MSQTNKTRYAILGVLTIGPMSGYDIKKFIETSIAYFWSENYGHLYPVLKRLEAEACIIRRAGEQTGDRTRFTYEITEKGRIELLEWLKKPLEPTRLRMELLFKTFFGDLLPVAENIKRLQQKRAEFGAILAEYAPVADSLRQRVAATDAPQALVYKLITVENGLFLNRAFLEWCDHSITLLEQIREAGTKGVRE